MDTPRHQAPSFRDPASNAGTGRRPLLLTLPALTGAIARPAVAQEAWPSRPISIVVPGPPGGTGDIIARGMIPTLTHALGRPLIVENRPGANGEVGTRYVARTPPDGYTLLLGSIGHFAINFALRPTLSYDPLRDFDPVTLAATTPNILVVNPRTVPATDLPSLIAFLRSRGDRASYATSGIGSSDHLTAELFKSLTDTRMQHIPYPGGPPALTDLIGGNVEMAFFNLGNVTPHVREGRLRAILITSPERSSLLPDVPTGVELGLRDLVVTSWQAFAVPAGTPAPVIARLNRELAAALREPTVVSRMGDLGFRITASSPEEFRTFQVAEIERWRALINRQGIRAE
jgi:tripartite-type tricarboxylate transporter receptor subunit TctC